MPATDTAAMIANNGVGVADLCGPRQYKIMETKPATFNKISAPADGNNFTSAWSIKSASYDFSDIGVWLVSL